MQAQHAEPSEEAADRVDREDRKRAVRPDRRREVVKIGCGVVQSGGGERDEDGGEDAELHPAVCARRRPGAEIAAT